MNSFIEESKLVLGQIVQIKLDYLRSRIERFMRYLTTYQHHDR